MFLEGVGAKVASKWPGSTKMAVAWGPGSNSQERMGWDCTCKGTGNWEKATIKLPGSTVIFVARTGVELVCSEQANSGGTNIVSIDPLVLVSASVAGRRAAGALMCALPFKIGRLIVVIKGHGQTGMCLVGYILREQCRGLSQSQSGYCMRSNESKQSQNIIQLDARCGDGVSLEMQRRVQAIVSGQS
jgi:hypothetical protein